MKKRFLECVFLVGEVPSQYSGNRKYVSTGAVDEDHIDYDKVEDVDYSSKPSRANLTACSGDILFAKMQNTRKTLLIEPGMEDYIFSTGFYAVRANENVILPECLFFLIDSEVFLRKKDKLCTGATMKAITNAGLKDIWLDVPELTEQKSIARKLELISKQIANRRKQLDMFDQLVKSRFIELFESKSWETVRADSIMFNMRNGVSPSNTGKYLAKVLTLSAITQGDFDSSSWKDGMFEAEPPIEKRVTSSDFYMCRGNGNKNLVGAGVYSKENRYDLVFPDTVIAATVDLQRVCLPYLFHSWMRPSVRDQIEAGARTTNGTYKINQGVVSNIELMLPPLELQNVFAAFVEQTDKSKLAVQKALEELEILKKSLMQQYFG